MSSRDRAKASGDLPIVIVGAGFAGIGMAIRLKQAGIHSFRIFERASEVGGTWRDNTYPGAACDVPSHVYSYSFEPNPDWSRFFSPAEEIQAYILRCVEKYGIRDHIEFGTEIADASFDERSASWTITTASGERHEARVVVSCTGGLVNPALPEIEGLEGYQGKLIHTARWDHGYDLRGKRVAVIGTGCSAIQVIPAIADDVASMSVFQRTPAWVMPKHDRLLSEKTRARFRRFPFLQRIMRTLLYLFSESLGPIIVLNSKRLSRIGERISLRHLEASVRDPELRKKLTPNFQFGCKRMLISDDYWPTLEREHVELVTEPIAAMTERGIRTSDGAEREFDAVIAATGFEVSFVKPAYPIRGLGGIDLHAHWQGAPEAYKGVSVAGFPNYFTIMGPNTGPGHTSVLVFTEAQIHYIMQAIQKLRREPIRYLTVKKEVQDRYNVRIQGRMKYTVWTSGCTSWYLGKNGRNSTLFPGFAGEYVLRTRRFKASEYDIAA